MCPEYVPAIGIEVHAQLNTLSKMFCSCSAKYGDPPNTHLCPVCLGLPGSLPRVNRKAVILGLRAVRALGCSIPPVAQFARKNYFYPDLPKGYQITMFQLPLGAEGKLDLIDEDDKQEKGVGIERVHIEEDTGKLNHEGRMGTLIDFNRAGVPLIEIVSKPEIKSGSHAVKYLKELRRLLRFLKISHANMEEGSFRCVVNVSVRPSDREELGTRVEIKNLNSFRAVERSIDFEIKRQTNILKSKGEVKRETRGWDEKEEATVHQRFKEGESEYRYFPEPDLPDLLLEGDILDESTFDLSKIPARKVKDLVNRFGVPPHGADLLMSGTGSPEANPYFVAEFFEEAVGRHGGLGTPAANLMTGVVFEFLKKSGLTLDQTDFTAKKLAQITKMVSRDELSSTSAKMVISLILEQGGEVNDIVMREGYAQVVDDDEISVLVREIIEANEPIVEQIKRGKLNAIGALVGAVMKKSKGDVDPKRVNELLQERILGKKNRG